MEEQKNSTPGTEEQQQAQENVAQQQAQQPGNQSNSSTPPGEGNKPGTTQTNPEDGKQKPEGQSKEENSKFAKERHERDIKKAKAAGDAEGYKRARIKSVGGKNPYTDSPIESDEDFELYELQDEVKQNGGDPKSVYEVEKLRRQKIEEARQRAESEKTEQQKNEEKASREIKEYLDEGHTQEELNAHWKDPKFMEFASDLLGAVPLKTIIAKFEKAYPKENQQVRQQVANKVSSPGGASNDEQEVPTKKVSEMSKEEFKQYMEDIKSGKKKIE